MINFEKLPERVGEQVRSIVEDFKNGKIVEVIPEIYLIDESVPMAKWSPFNKLLAMKQGATDARTFKQWEALGRYAKKGSRGFCILKPIVKKGVKKEIDPDTLEEVDVEYKRASRYIASYEFDISQTEGEEVIYETVSGSAPRLEPTKLALSDIARKLNIYVGTDFYKGSGEIANYHQVSDTMGYIALKGNSEYAFIQQLCKAIHLKEQSPAAAKASEKNENKDIYNNVVADISASVIAKSLKLNDPQANQSFLALAATCTDENQIMQYCMYAVKDIEKVLRYVMANTNNEKVKELEKELATA